MLVFSKILILSRKWPKWCFQNVLKQVKVTKKLPEEQAEDCKGTNVGSASGNSGEQPSDETDEDENKGVPDAEVLDRVVRHSLVLPKKCYLIVYNLQTITSKSCISVCRITPINLCSGNHLMWSWLMLSAAYCDCLGPVCSTLQ